MEGSLASMFMDPSYTLTKAQASEELQYQLIYAALEVENFKASMTAEGKLQQAQLLNLQELLDKTRRERDEALEECRNLRERLSLQGESPLVSKPSVAADPCSFVHGASLPSSRSSSCIGDNPSASSLSASRKPWSFQDAPMELHQQLQLLHQSGNDSQSIFSPEVGNEVYASQKFSLEVLDLELEQAPVLELAELHQQIDDYVVQGSVPLKTKSLRCLSRQSSANSSSASVRHYQMQSIVESSDMSAPTYIADSGSPLTTVACPVTAGFSVGATPECGGIAKPIKGTNSLEFVSEKGLASEAAGVQIQTSNVAPSDTNGKAAVIPAKGCSTEAMMYNGVAALPSKVMVSNSMPGLASEFYPSKAIANNISSAGVSSILLTDAIPGIMPAQLSVSSASIVNHPLRPVLSSSAAGAMMPLSEGPIHKVHLPEPPEADPQVMLSTLPERGKLLQAVMEAGPLLQTLLLAGPLPQWRHPPPALGSGDIPKVFIPGSSSSGLLSHHTQVLAFPSGRDMMPSYMLKSSVPRQNVWEPNGDSCSRSRKLRRISPLLEKGGDHGRMSLAQSMHYGDVLMAFPSSIY